MNSTLAEGTANFTIETPYKLIETGEGAAPKPLIVYLHGFKQNMEQFERLVDEMLGVEGYHLFIQAPYPIYDRSRKKKVKDWGRSWYLYDGEQEQFVQSLEKASGLVEEIIKQVSGQVLPSRLALVGYSMGGYLAGYYALSRSSQVDELVVIGARIKTEVFEDHSPNYEQLNVLALHGTADKSVKSAPQQKSCRRLSEWGAKVTFKELEQTHRLSPEYLKETYGWLNQLGYNLL